MQGVTHKGIQLVQKKTEKPRENTIPAYETLGHVFVANIYRTAFILFKGNM